MLGKLMKYEFRSTGRTFLPLYGALIIIAALNRLLYNMHFETPKVIGTFLATMLIVGVAVITLVLTLQRFRRNLLGTEGYLMFTLPVNTDALIWSKLITSAVWFVASAGVVMLSIFIMAMKSDQLQELLKALSSLHITDPNATWVIAEFALMCLVSLFAGVLTFYACMALSLLFNKRRGLAAFGMFIGFNFLQQVLMGAAIGILDPMEPSRLLNTMNSIQQAATFIGCILLWNAVFGVAFYLITRYMLKRKLNLE